MAALRRLLNDVKNNLYEKVDNNAKAFRFIDEETEDIKNKIKYIEKHLRDAQQHPKTEREQILCYGNLATAYYKLNNFITARSYYMIQLEMAEEYKDLVSQRMAHANLGVLDKIDYNLHSALDHYNKSLDIATKSGNKMAMGRLYNNIANIYEMTMDFEQAISFQKQRFDLAKEANESDAIIKTCACLAALHHTMNDWPNTISYYEQLMEQLRKILKVIDTLADDASGSEDGGYINIDDEEEDQDGENQKEGNKAKSTKLTKITGIFKRKKKTNAGAATK